jgi:hypothetical protein
VTVGRISEREKQLELALQNKTDATELAQAMIRIGLNALSMRMLTTISLLGDCVLFGWAMAYPDVVRLTAAVLFAIATWCLVNVKLEKLKD